MEGYAEGEQGGGSLRWKGGGAACRREVCASARYGCSLEGRVEIKKASRRRGRGELSDNCAGERSERKLERCVCEGREAHSSLLPKLCKRSKRVSKERKLISSFAYPRPNRTGSERLSSRPKTSNASATPAVRPLTMDSVTRGSVLHLKYQLPPPYSPSRERTCWDTANEAGRSELGSSLQSTSKRPFRAAS